MTTIKKILTTIISIIIGVCNGAKLSQQTTQSTTTTQTSLSPVITLAPVTLTVVEELPTATATPVCADAANLDNPLGRLRAAMRNPVYTQMNAFFDAFIIFFSDEHLSCFVHNYEGVYYYKELNPEHKSEEPSAEERRLEYISGWDGVGTAAVLADGGAAVWVPSGDVNRARSILSCAWLVLDADEPSQPTVTEWISERLGRHGRVGSDARLTSIGEWQAITSALQHEKRQFIHIPTLIDQLWSDELEMSRRRPEFTKIVASLHDDEYTGISWREKVSLVRSELRAVGADAMVVTALDEVAWLLNVRGRDVPYAPLLKAFVIVSQKDVKIFAPPGKLSLRVRAALSVYNCFTNNCTRVYDYTAIYAELQKSTESKILIPAAGTFQRGASSAIVQSVPATKRMFLLSPIIYLKAQKNEAEARGMRTAHLKDAVAMCNLLSYLENKPALSEISVATTVDFTRETQAGYVGAAMKTRVAFGASAVEPEYRATNVSNKRIFKNSTLVIQSGGQYYEGTTVVTRTVHYGTPTQGERRAYTTVLRSLAALAMLNIPSTLPAAHVDPVIRAPLWAANQDYQHPTGNGVGAALNRKEDPVVVDYRQDTNLHTFREGYFINIEPGWYEIGKYGIRLGNVFEVISKANAYLAFMEATLVPFEPKLIDKSMLTDYEINWLNAYNGRIRKVVGGDLQSLGLTDVYYWMMNKTMPIEIPSKVKKLQTSSSASGFDMREITTIIFGFILLESFL